VAVREALHGQGAAARLKWPNDVLVGERKLAGILAEASSGALGVEWVVVGLGLNVDPEMPLPEGATSLRELSGGPIEVAVVAAAVLRQLRSEYLRAAAGQVAQVLAAWRQASVDWWGRAVVARAGEREIRGLALGIDDDGALLLQLADGSQRRVLAGEVTRVRPAEAGA
jgi:BirA family biotin operon repressor/biotin-[acetyl-CoA-carboxylase] ligase